VKQFTDSKHREKVMDRIQKLINVANGTQYEAEAATAMRMAQSYMKQFGLAMTDIQLSEKLEELIIREDISHNNRMKTDKWEVYLASAVGTVFDCEVILRCQGRASFIQFVGYKEDIILAKLTYKALFLGAKQASHQYPRGIQKKSFLTGLANRLAQRATEEKEKDKQSSGRYDLVVVEKGKKIDQFMDGIGLKRSKRRPTKLDHEAYNKGREHANTMNLNNREKLN